MPLTRLTFHDDARPGESPMLEPDALPSSLNKKLANLHERVEDLVDHVERLRERVANKNKYIVGEVKRRVKELVAQRV